MDKGNPLRTQVTASVNTTDEMPSPDEVTLGQWYWVTTKNRTGDGTEDHLACVTHLASNHAVMTTPSDGSTRVFRIRYEQIPSANIRLEPNADAIIAAKIADLQRESARLIGEVTALMARLGMGAGPNALTQRSEGSGTALMAMAGAVDINGYKNALIAAQKKDFPDLFKEIERVNSRLAAWMMAPTLALTAQVGPLKERVQSIEDRIFSVELYAGLTESVLQIADGAPAGMTDKLHVMQRRLYMDEECLAAYSEGGMDVRDIKQFNAWLARPENRDRLLPWPRTLVTMRVRRFKKERDNQNSLIRLLDNAALAEADKWTFLYVRNGEQLWCLACQLEFGAMLFPDETRQTGGPLMVCKSGFLSGAAKLMSVALFERLSAQFADWEERAAAWKRDNPDADWFTQPTWVSHGGPQHHRYDFRPTEWEPLTPESLDYDEVMAAIGKEVAAYNRVCLIIQGLFDRSPILHPHPPARLWTAEGFGAALELVYDQTRALYAAAEPPDFESYRRRCNASLGVGSVVAGVREVWLRREAEKENRRLMQDHRRHTSDPRYTHYEPYGDEGPGWVSTVAKWAPRSRTGTIRWTRATRGWRAERNAIPVSLTWADDDAWVFNVSAYKPGDYKQFFADPRTREQYLKWAPLLMAAEDWHAGRLVERRDMPGMWDFAERS
ncbi:MAG: hypothetical protein HQL38_03115 [Alphaproteobacteria bacterium]|nr:hypothetical protein [Alphaproteobacteria bacterium]